jgi:D-cysteine desulfhydrase
VHRVEHASIAGEMWIKRDDLNADACGGNKVRSLEFLLGGISSADTVVTIGGAGSNHVLSTIRHVEKLGAKAVAFRWTHDMNPAARAISAQIEAIVPTSILTRNTVLSLITARLHALKTRGRYIPIGGSTPVGILGHVNAALELDAQIRAGVLPKPEKIVLPLGSGGTTAGLLLGFAIAEQPIEIVGVRVGPRAFVHSRRVLSLAKRTAALIERITGDKPPSVDRRHLRVVHDFYGGAYGRPLVGADQAAAILREAAHVRLDDTYSAKAWTAALNESRSARGPVLFWLTFDSRCLTN